MAPLLDGRRVVVVDDVVSSGASMATVLRLLDRAGVAPQAAVFAMVQGDAWKGALSGLFPLERIHGAIASPRLRRTADGSWIPA